MMRSHLPIALSTVELPLEGSVLEFARPDRTQKDISVSILSALSPFNEFYVTSTFCTSSGTISASCRKRMMSISDGMKPGAPSSVLYIPWAL